MELILKSLKSKTVVFGIALAVLSVLQGYIGFLPTPASQAIVGCVIASCIVVLRSVTVVPLIKK